MTDELFPAETISVKSPRLRWLEKHDIRTKMSVNIAEEDEPWNCWAGDLQDAINHDEVTTGRTEHDAIALWAEKNHLRLWNEE